MMRPRVILASCSMAVTAAVMAISIAHGPEAGQPWLLVCGVVAIAAAAQSVALSPADLTYALLFSLPPVVALIADGSPTWLIGPLGTLLLVAAELNALSWECHGAGPMSTVQRRRLLNTGRLASLGFAAALAAALAAGAVAPGVSVGGTAAVVVAAAAIAGLGFVVFRTRPGAGSALNDPPPDPRRSAMRP